MSKSTDEAKLAKPLEIEDYDTLENLIETVLGDSVSIAIYRNEDCNLQLHL